jgi:hypothetical protein
MLRLISILGAALKVTPINLNSRRLSFTWAWCSCLIEYDDEHLTWTKERFPERYVTRTPLWRLMPEGIVEHSVPQNLRAETRGGLYLVIAAGVIFWSEIPRYVPLLAPALLLFGVWKFLQMFLAVSKFEGRPFEATKFVTEYGEEVAAIPHYSQIKEPRQAFEKQLMEKVNEARYKQYGV